MRWRSVLDLLRSAIQKQLAQGPVDNPAVFDARSSLQIIDCANGRPVGTHAGGPLDQNLGCVVQWPEMGVRLRLEALWQIDGRPLQGLDPRQTALPRPVPRQSCPVCRGHRGTRVAGMGLHPKRLGP